MNEKKMKFKKMQRNIKNRFMIIASYFQVNLMLALNTS